MSNEVTLEQALDWITSHASKQTLEGMARFGIPSTHAKGVTVGELKAYAKKIGKDHALATALWESGWYEARILAAFVGEPERLTLTQMDRWAADFDNWAICDTVCFHLFDRTPHAWKKVHAWANAKADFKKRAAFATLWGLSVHDKQADDASFLACLPLAAKAATDERDYVKKGVDMALRATGKRNEALRQAVIKVAETLRDSDRASAAWIGRRTLSELAKAPKKGRSKKR